MPRKFVTENTAAAVGEATERGTVPIIVATPGWGSSGWYGAPVLENAVNAKVFPKGLHLYMDHPAESEMYERPERSVRDLVGTLTEDATWDATTGIVGEAKIFGPYRDLFRDEDFTSAIGVSLRASADTTVGEAEGRRGTIITELIEAASVDFVTKAGRGGRVLAALESARASVREATTDDVRDRLTRALRDLYPDDEDGYSTVWVVDFDPEAATVYFRNRDGLHAQGYTLTADGVELGEGLMEVRQVSTYLPVTGTTDATEASHKPPVAPAGSTPTHESQEDTMSTTTIEESRLAALEADAGRVQTLESERDTATASATAAENRAAAVEALAESGHTFTKLERKGLLADLPVDTESGALDVEAFTQAIEEAAAEHGGDVGTGVTGFGSTTSTGDTVAESTDDGWGDIDSRLGITKEA